MKTITLLLIAAGESMPAALKAPDFLSLPPEFRNEI
jgi:hypothetical protein